MANIDGEYNYGELCLEARVTPPWLKKVQKILGLESSGMKRGNRFYYTKADVYLYSMVKKLRNIGLEFDEIKNIFDTERQLRDCIKKSKMEWTEESYEKDSVGGETLTFIMSPYLVYIKDYSDFVMSTTMKKLILDVIGYQKYIIQRADEINAVSKELRDKVSVNLEMGVSGQEKLKE